MCIQQKTGDRLDEPRLIHVFKPHTHTLYILRYCINIVYLSSLVLLNFEQNLNIQMLNRRAEKYSNAQIYSQTRLDVFSPISETISIYSCQNPGTSNPVGVVSTQRQSKTSQMPVLNRRTRYIFLYLACSTILGSHTLEKPTLNNITNIGEYT